jgi:hypothetical protein
MKSYVVLVIVAAITMLIDIINITLIELFDVCMYPAPFAGMVASFALIVLAIMLKAARGE